MVFGILSLGLKNKILGIIAIISGTTFTIMWLVVGSMGEGSALLGAFILIAFTGLPDIIMGIISVASRNKQVNFSSSEQTNSNEKSSSLTDKLAEINSLKETGLLSEEEYLEVKKSILKN